MPRAALACAFSLTFLLVTCRLATAQSRDAATAAVPHAAQYDLKSRQNGQTYRLSIALPFTIDPKVAYPVFYVLDGNFFFGSAAYVEAKLTHDGDAAPAVVVSDAFLRFIEEEVKPFVAAHFKVDSSKQTLFGNSLGGLLALDEMFKNPTAFSTYILSSPVIFWNDRKVLANEAAFAMRAKTGALHLRILVTSAGEEQNPKDPGAVEARMIDNASELAERLAAVSPRNIVVG